MSEGYNYICARHFELGRLDSLRLEFTFDWANVLNNGVSLVRADSLLSQCKNSAVSMLLCTVVVITFYLYEYICHAVKTAGPKSRHRGWFLRFIEKY